MAPVPRRRPSRAIAGRVALLAVASAVAVSIPGRADLDVAVPPNLPFEWEAPSRVPTQSLRLPEREVAEEDPGNTTRERRPAFATEARPPIDAERTTAMALARITTVDLIGEIGWQGNPGEGATVPVAKGRATTGRSKTFGETTSADYPPPMPADVWWIVLGTLLRKLMHPNLISELETVERLVEMGSPALGALADLAAQNWMKGGVRGGKPGLPVAERWIAELGKRVGALPARKPRALAGDTPRETMLRRLVADDLARGYAASVDPRFAERILALPDEEGSRLLILYTDPHVHPLLRRNAVALLAAYRSPEVTTALVEVLKSGDDGVVAQRAFLALAAAGGPELEGLATGRGPKGVDSRTLVHALGLARSSKGVEPALKLIKSKASEDILVGVRALGRIGVADKKVMKGLQALVKRVERAKAGIFFEPPWIPADVKDVPGIKRDLIHQLAMICLARLGHESATKAFLAAIAKSPAADPGNFFLGRNPQASPGTFGALAVPTWGFAVEALDAMGEPGRPRLRMIAADRVCEPGLRLAALRALERGGASIGDLLPPMLGEVEASIRAAALARQADLDPDDARAKARSILASWYPGRGEGFAAITAAAVLGRDDAGVEGAIGAKEVSLREAPAPDAKELKKVPGRTSGFRVVDRRDGWIEIEKTEPGGALKGWLEEDAFEVTTSNVKTLARIVGLAPKPATPPPPGMPRPGMPRPGAPRPSPLGRGSTTNPLLEYDPPVLEACVRALGELGSDEAGEALLAHLKERRNPAMARGLAAIGVGTIGGKTNVDALVRALETEVSADDGDGWVRFCIATALAHDSRVDGVEPDVDWIRGEKKDLEAGLEAFDKWSWLKKK